MRRDFEDLYDLDDLSDQELEELIRQKLEERDELDADAVDVAVKNGRVHISGRVGTEEEIQEIEQILDDDLGVSNYVNDVIVDETTRAEHSEAADVTRVEDAAVEDELGERGKRTEDTAEHLLPDTEGELYGTHDMQKAVERGESYNPPDRPPQM
ncbi:MAG: BON domain-containing protein, partial [Longimicrobiales bacterium]